MTLTISGAKPSATRSWVPRIRVRGDTADVPGGGQDLSKLQADYRDMPSDVPPADASEGDVVASVFTFAAARGYTWTFRNDFDLYGASLLGESKPAITPLAEGHHLFLVLYDPTAGGDAPVVAAADLTP